MRFKSAMSTLAATAAVFTLTVGSVQAEGDIAKGEKFFKRCKACHSLEAGKKKVGPSLHQIVDRQAGTAENFKFSSSYVEAGEKGLTWTAENLIAYLEDPKKFLRDYLDDKRAKSKMVMKFKKLSDRENVVAYLQSLQKAE